MSSRPNNDAAPPPLPPRSPLPPVGGTNHPLGEVGGDWRQPPYYQLPYHLPPPPPGPPPNLSKNISPEYSPSSAPSQGPPLPPRRPVLSTISSEYRPPIPPRPQSQQPHWTQPVSNSPSSTTNTTGQPYSSPVTPHIAFQPPPTDLPRNLSSQPPPLPPKVALSAPLQVPKTSARPASMYDVPRTTGLTPPVSPPQPATPEPRPRPVSTHFPPPPPARQEPEYYQQSFETPEAIVSETWISPSIEIVPQQSDPVSDKFQEEMPPSKPGSTELEDAESQLWEILSSTSSPKNETNHFPPRPLPPDSTALSPEPPSSRSLSPAPLSPAIRKSKSDSKSTNVSPSKSEPGPVDLETSFNDLSLGQNEPFERQDKSSETKADESLQNGMPEQEHADYSGANTKMPPTSSSGSQSSTKQDLPRHKTLASCLDTPLDIATTWYWHAATPDFLICSKCYVNHVLKSQFHGAFASEYLDAAPHRVCRFSKTRMKEHLFPAAVLSGSLDKAIQWMQLRPTIKDCLGVAGTKGGHGVNWYKPVADDIPGLVVCEACYEDHVFPTQFRPKFQPVPQNMHQPQDTWACDMAVSFIQRVFEYKAKSNDWCEFVSEAKARLSFEPCPGQQARGTYKKAWFVPHNGPAGLIICVACWADHVLWTGEDDKWRQATELQEQTGNNVQCSLSKLHILMSMARSHETKKYSHFWNTIDKLSKSPACDSNGIADGRWWTLPSDPEGFGICQACYVGFGEGLEIDHLFRPKITPPGSRLLCCLNPSHPRFSQYLQQVVKIYHTHDTTAFEDFARVWANIMPCQRNQDAPDMPWYGWLDCTICPECHATFTSKHPRMVAQMELKNKKLPNNFMCEIYSPRMRRKFEECVTLSDGVDQQKLKEMLEFSLHRRQVYMNTVPQMRMFLMQAKMNSAEQTRLGAMSMLHMQKGHNDQLVWGSPYSWSAPGMMGSYGNYDLLLSAQYNQQSMNIVSNMGTMTMQVEMLEQKWRAVE